MKLCTSVNYIILHSLVYNTEVFLKKKCNYLFNNFHEMYVIYVTIFRGTLTNISLKILNSCSKLIKIIIFVNHNSLLLLVYNMYICNEDNVM